MLGPRVKFGRAMLNFAEELPDSAGAKLAPIIGGTLFWPRKMQSTP